MRGIKNSVKQTARHLLGDRNDRKVDFLICGTQKGGTSALDAYLRDHPEICMADKKEVHFFDNEKYFKTNNPNYSIYHSWFNPKASHKLLGEATPIYMYWRNGPQRIWDYNPRMKLIIILRNPIDRAYSHWNMENSKDLDRLPFLEAIQREQERSREALPYQHRVYSYIDRGFYLEQLRRIWRYFPKEHVFIIKNEDLRNQPHTILGELCDFLGIERFKSITLKNVHSRPYATEMSNEERQYLGAVFNQEIKDIEKVLGWDCTDWLIGE